MSRLGFDWVSAAEKGKEGTALEQCLCKKTVIKELHQHQTENTEVVFTTAPALCQHHKNCSVYSIFCAFYILLTTQPCTIQQVSPCFRLQLHFIELNKGVLSLQSSSHAMRVAIKWQKRAPRQAETLANSVQLQNTRHQEHRQLAGRCVRASTLCVCLKVGGIWICRARAKRRLKGRRHLERRLSEGEWNLISSPANLVLFHWAPGSRRRTHAFLWQQLFVPTSTPLSVRWPFFGRLDIQ